MKVKLADTLPEIEAPWWKPTWVGYSVNEDRLRCVFFGAWLGSSWESADMAQAKLGSEPLPAPGNVLGYISSSTAEVVS